MKHVKEFDRSWENFSIIFFEWFFNCRYWMWVSWEQQIRISISNRQFIETFNAYYNELLIWILIEIVFPRLYGKLLKYFQFKLGQKYLTKVLWKGRVVNKITMKRWTKSYCKFLSFSISKGIQRYQTIKVQIDSNLFYVKSCIKSFYRKPKIYWISMESSKSSGKLFSFYVNISFCEQR